MLWRVTSCQERWAHSHTFGGFLAHPGTDLPIFFTSLARPKMLRYGTGDLYSVPLLCVTGNTCLGLQYGRDSEQCSLKHFANMEIRAVWSRACWERKCTNCATVPWGFLLLLPVSLQGFSVNSAASWSSHTCIKTFQIYKVHKECLMKMLFF
jgi:hypothetical protein